MAGVQTMKTCRLTIVEGCDGSGKTTFARRFAEATQAHYMHFGPLLHLKDQLARIYVEAMQPALFGHQDVVFDRSWLSEMPYGVAFRHGKDRLGVVVTRMLERLALRCGAVVVQCRPPWHMVRQTFLKRKAKEYLKDTTQLHQVYRLYDEQHTALPQYRYNFYNTDILTPEMLDVLRTPRHEVAIRSAGNLNAKCILVGENFADQTHADAFYQWPFASFGKGGCSSWFTQQLVNAQISEADLLWVNCDQPAYWTILPDHHASHIFALGHLASKSLMQVNVNHQMVAHPQSHKRFQYTKHYPLTAAIQSALKGT